MANGPLGKEGFGYAAIVDALQPEIAELEKAQGDIIAAAEDLRLPELRARKAREDQAVSRRQLAEELAEMGLVGKKAKIKSGMAEVVVQAPGGAHLFWLSKRAIAGAEGTIKDTEAGTVFSRPIEPAEAIVLHVGVKGSLLPPRLPRTYAIVAHEVDFEIEGTLHDPHQDEIAEPAAGTRETLSKFSTR